ncbi:PREDICTED: U4/U6.U5 small nuclear ribonucleoprotein 27 kDa protein [Corvus brachyrhynchos]|uniref:U4/U6.U5 small nuclear ribonucleoprotein 27 kDa protein n=1 Tax=Corvus brachyrhynchos TaxID=85066 RepID=UPI0008163EC2|nr:PREDICTED: U4/U6.U5 small nuclear ribonucleoprotein 27 kDa protein [Corvus brachyrhynchos]
MSPSWQCHYCHATKAMLSLTPNCQCHHHRLASFTPINDLHGTEGPALAKGERLMRCKVGSIHRLLDLYGWAQLGHAAVTRRRRRSRSTSRDRDRRRSRSRSPHRRRSRSPRRHRSSSSSPARPKERRDEEKKELKDSKKERQITEEDLQGKTEEEIEMMKMMGFASFDTTKGKKVDGAANAYAINVSQKRKYRQYMNRKGGFNRPLDFIA